MRAARRIAAALALAAASVAAAAQDGESLLPVYTIVDDSVQLRSGQRDVSTYEDTEYAPNVRDCGRVVQEHVDTWLKKKGRVASLRRSRNSRVRFEVAVASPRPGTLIIDYAWLPSQLRASLDLRFLSGDRIAPAEREKLVLGLGLVDLRSELTSVMRCS